MHKSVAATMEEIMEVSTLRIVQRAQACHPGIPILAEGTAAVAVIARP
jgi:hypothetical protein